MNFAAPRHASPTQSKPYAQNPSPFSPASPLAPYWLKAILGNLMLARNRMVHNTIRK
jgi:hypothetical protein